MEVILREHVEHLGQRGDVVKVAAGYAATTCCRAPHWP
jgi:ribosomal protein L9